MRQDSGTAPHVYTLAESYTQPQFLPRAHRDYSAKRQINMASHSQLYETFKAENMTDDMLAEAAHLFNSNYGT